MGKSLLEVLTEVATHPDKQAVFDDNPARYLAEYGYEDVDADVLSEAFSLVADTLPPDVAQSVAGPATAPPDVDDGRGGAPDTAMHPDEDAFGGVDDSFDAAALNGAPGDDDGLDVDDDGAADVADGNGGYGTGELSLGDLDDDGLDADQLDAGDTVAFGVGSEGAGAAGDSLGDSTVPDTDHDGIDDAFELTDDGTALDDVDDGPVDDPSFDDIGSF